MFVVVSSSPFHSPANRIENVSHKVMEADQLVNQEKTRSKAQVKKYVNFNDLLSSHVFKNRTYDHVKLN